MRILLRLIGPALIPLLGAGCAFPSDDSDKVFVSIASLDTAVVVRRGDKLRLYARMYHASGADTVEIQNVRFLWTSDDGDVATVEAGGLGSAEVTGVNSGVVNINARAVAFERAQSDLFAVRVANAVEVDSVRPKIVRWGDTVRVYGVGVDSLILAFLADATLFDYPIPGLIGTRTRDSLGYATAKFWVPPPARTDSVSYIGPGVFGYARDTTRVLPFDVYEPNDVNYRAVNLEGPPILPSLPQLRFYNPALAFEQTKRDVTGADWYRFTQTTARDLTIIINSSEVRGAFETYVTDSIYWDNIDSTYYIGLDGWTVGPGTYICHGRGFFPTQLRPESTVVALRQVPVTAPVLHALSLYSEPGRYGLTVFDGYATASAAFPRDQHEEDDFCNAADAQPHPAANPGFRDSLTIDNAHEVDWIRFRMNAAVAQVVRFRTASLVAGDTTSDIDLYVLSDTSAGLTGLNGADGIRVGSDEDFTLVLGPGEYYAVVVDYAGVPTRYTLCIGTTYCNTATFPAPAASSALQPSRRPKVAAPARPPRVRPARRPSP